MSAETNERIERLQEHYNSAYEVMLAYMGWDPIDAIQGCGLFKSALIDLLERSDPDEWMDEQLEEYGLVRLPRDKDGEYINVGDTVYYESSVAWENGAWEVISVSTYSEYGVRIVCERYKKQRIISPNELTHHPPVTVESVLREFGDKYIQVVESPNPIVGFSNEIIGEEDPEKTIAEYAKRLQLAGVHDGN